MHHKSVLWSYQAPMLTAGTVQDVESLRLDTRKDKQIGDYST